MYVTPEKRARKNGLYFINDAMFLHLGKAGGGGITERIRHLGFNILYQHNHYVVRDPWESSKVYVMALRDPVDRLMSNFYWSGLILCHPKSGSETRKKSNGVPHRTAEVCRVSPRNDSASLADMIHTRYKGNVNNLAEALCSDDPMEQEQAAKDVQSFPHAGTTIQDWLDFYYDDTSRIPVGMVLEKGYDFMGMVDGALEFALRYSLMHDAQQEGGEGKAKTKTNNDQGDPSDYEAAAREIFQQQLADLNERLANKESRHKSFHDHSSHEEIGENHPAWVQSMHENQKLGLSEKGACCLAKVMYREDYELIIPPAWRDDPDSDSEVSPLADLACHGPAEAECRGAITNMAKRMVDRKCNAVVKNKSMDTTREEGNVERHNESVKVLMPDTSLVTERRESSELSHFLTLVTILMVGSIFALFRRRGSSTGNFRAKTPPGTPTRAGARSQFPSGTPPRSSASTVELVHC
mmetsp:Transcript_9887/g.29351  ORF Transcript_9887/g.29351 Transcript_9887/m.29351 type:complete len:467 (-) Transcript_9887:240-1640(-)